MNLDRDVPAFPTPDGMGNCYFGLTKREWFAGQAMIALMSSKRISDELISHKDRSAVVLSAMAFDLADAMIRESRK